MIYLDNIIFSLQKSGGISVVWQNLLDYVVKSQSDYRVMEYPGAENMFRKLLNIPAEKIISMKGFSRIFSQYVSPKVKEQDKFIFHSSYFRTCNNPNAVNVTTVHDFIYEQDPNPTLKQKLRMRLNYRAIRNSDAVVCVSENTRRDLLRLLPEVDPSKVTVIHNGVSEDYRVLDEKPYPEYSNHVLFVGGRQGYKNFDFVVEALAGTEYKLLICGGKLTESEREKLERLMPGRYVMKTFPDNEELNRLYNSAHCLAYVSSYEGFGIPVLEAQRSGCPIVALNASSIPEVTGDGGLMIETLSADSFVKAVRSLGNKELRDDLIRKGLENSKLFSWTKMAQEYTKLYSRLLGEPR